VFDGQRVRGLWGQGRGVEGRGPAERGDDVVEHAADSDGRVGQVDDHVPAAVQGGGGGADGDGFAGADLAGDHPEGVLVHAPADPGDGLAQAAVPVQHARGEVAAEGHAGEAVFSELFDAPWTVTVFGLVRCSAWCFGTSGLVGCAVGCGR
jgi:hypothetical protein